MNQTEVFKNTYRIYVLNVYFKYINTYLTTPKRAYYSVLIFSVNFLDDRR